MCEVRVARLTPKSAGPAACRAKELRAQGIQLRDVLRRRALCRVSLSGVISQCRVFCRSPAAQNREAVRERKSLSGSQLNHDNMNGYEQVGVAQDENGRPIIVLRDQGRLAQ